MAAAATHTRRPADPGYVFLSNNPRQDALPEHCYEGQTKADLHAKIVKWITESGLTHDEAKWPFLVAYSCIANDPELAAARHKQELLFNTTPLTNIQLLDTSLKMDFGAIKKGVSVSWIIENCRRLVDIVNVNAAVGGSDQVECNETATKVHTLIQRLFGVGQVSRAYCHLEDQQIASDNQATVNALSKEEILPALKSTDTDPVYAGLMEAFGAAKITTVEALEALTGEMQKEVDKFSTCWETPFAEFRGHFTSVYKSTAPDRLSERLVHIEKCYNALQALGVNATSTERFYFLTYMSRFTNTNGEGKTCEQGIFAQVNQSRRAIFSFLSGDTWLPQLKNNQLSPLLAANLYYNQDLVKQVLEWAAAADAGNGMLCLRDLRSQEGGNQDFAEHPYAYKRLHGTGPGLSFGDESGLLHKLFEKIDTIHAEAEQTRSVSPPDLVSAHSEVEEDYSADPEDGSTPDASPNPTDATHPMSIKSVSLPNLLRVEVEDDSALSGHGSASGAGPADSAEGKRRVLTGSDSGSGATPQDALTQLGNMDHPRQCLVYGRLFDIMKAAGKVNKNDYEWGDIVFNQSEGYEALMRNTTVNQLEVYRLQALQGVRETRI